MQRHNSPCRWLLVLAGMFMPASLSAQMASTISGYVTDPSGAAVPDASVTAIMLEQTFTRNVKSNGEGFYEILAMPSGTYRVEAEKAGFQHLIRSDITLTVSQNLRLDLGLQIGRAAESVNVSGAAPLVDSRSATLSALVDDRRVVDLPLNGRNVMSLAAIVPGVVNVSAPQELTNARQGPSMNVNGSLQDMNQYMFNGGYFMNPSRNSGMNYPPPDALQEFRILTQDFSAEYGRNAGSQVSVVSKAGTNEIHGAAWEFLRNNDLNARNFFASRVPALHQNQFGFAAGGPVRRDKLFVFASYQDLQDRPEAVAAQAFVPTAAQRIGDFSALLPKTVLKDPTDALTGKPFTDAAGNPCVAGNIISPSCISPVAQKLLPFLPQSPSGVVTTLSPNPKSDSMVMVRADWNQTERHSFFANYFRDHNTNDTPTQARNGNIGGYMGYGNVEETDMASLHDTYTFRPTLLNQAMLSFIRSTSIAQANAIVAPSTYGINLPTYPQSGSVTFTVPGQFTLDGSAGTTHFISSTWQYRDDLTWIKGRHTFKAGAELLHLYFRQLFLATPNFTFNGSRSGSALADFMLGAFSGLSMQFGVRDNDDTTIAPSVYFQDEFKVSARFTLTYGLRYEPFFPWSDRYNRLSAFQPGAQSTKIPDAPPGIVFAGDPGIPKGLVASDLNNFAPRLGFAWDVFGDGKTSLRGAYGIFYDSIKADSVSQENAPWAGTSSLFNGRIENPFGSLGQAPPPVSLGDHFGCVKSAAFPGVQCSLFPLPLAGLYIDGNLRTPYIQSWNLAIQRQLTSDLMVQAAYIGKAGIKIEGWRNYNPARYITDPVTGAAPSLQNVNDRVGTLPGILGPTGILEGNDFRDWYQGFQAHLTKRAKHGLTVNAAYTLAKSIDYISTDVNTSLLNNPFDLNHNRGRSDFDRHQVFVASWVWSPVAKFQHRWQNALLGSWTFTAIHTLETGTPLTFIMGDDVAQDGTGDKQSAQLNGAPIARQWSSRADMIAEYFNTAAFVPTAQVPRGTYGNSGRNIFSGPPLVNHDVSAIRDFPLWERTRLQFRSEFFNVLNEVNFGAPNVTVNSATFGRITSANGPRVIQLALKLLW
jgi:hypothetical protein